MSTAQTACPCDSGLPLQACCGRWHEGPQHLQAPDAPALMRSRYSAYALGRWAYILDTWHPSTRPATLEPLPEGLKWLGLQVKRTEVTGPTSAEVEFVARSKLAGQAHRMHELSRFVLEAGRWWYVDGQVR
ncbi:MAG: YchJ family protein [Betaproteobacteria bacterium]